MESILENFGRRWKIGVNLPSFLNSTPKDVAQWIGFHFEMQNRIDRIQHRQRTLTWIGPQLQDMQFAWSGS
jgi:hypothetical protein